MHSDNSKSQRHLRLVLQIILALFWTSSRQRRRFKKKILPSLLWILKICSIAIPSMPTSWVKAFYSVLYRSSHSTAWSLTIPKFCLFLDQPHFFKRGCHWVVTERKSRLNTCSNFAYGFCPFLPDRLACNPLHQS